MKTKFNPFLRLSALALITASFSQSALAATRTWSGTTNLTMDDSTNWGGFMPITTSEALIDTSVLTVPTALTLSSPTQAYGDLLINSPNLTSISATGTSNVLLTLSKGGGSTAAIAAGGATGDLILLGTNVTAGTVTIGGGSGSGSLNLALGATGGYLNVVNSGATLNVSSVISNTTAGYNLTKTGLGALLSLIHI